ncbi:cytochrome oxidase complex assembly protein 1-domain-containing protein [Terfezia claveryi]|nr:cytochrome oxidase complex assembly protein 1-domain-containing protein [Terfezia claveryi]
MSFRSAFPTTTTITTLVRGGLGAGASKTILPLIPRRALIAAPKAGQGPLLERRPDRALPDLRSSRRTLYLTLPLFLLTLGASTLLIFNYQKANSSVTTSTLFALRSHPVARELLGDEIQFSSRLPWIKGELDQFHGKIDIEYGVKGTKGEGSMRFRSTRKSRLGLFETEKWELWLRDGKVVDLLGNGIGQKDRVEPFPREAQGGM